MDKPTPNLSEEEVVALVHKLSPQGKMIVLRMFLSELTGEPGLGELLPTDDFFDDYDDDEAYWEEEEVLDRQHMLAAEIFGYSYAHYASHLGDHVRFDEIMPEQVDILEEAEEEGWDDALLAEALEIEPDQVGRWRRAFRQAREIVDAPNPAEAFRRGVRISIQNAVEEGLKDEQDIEMLVVQIGYRAADLAYLLDVEESELSDYSEELREEPDWMAQRWFEDRQKEM